MNETISISDYSPNALEAISEIEKECFSEPWSLNALNEFISSAFNNILVLKCDNKVAGYITYTKIFDEIQIANVAVSPNYRRKGFGFMLVSDLIGKAKSEDVQLITLEVRKSNTAAYLLYEKCGFETVGERKNYYSKPTENAILMNYTIPLKGYDNT